jgi:hypothetical protein
MAVIGRGALELASTPACWRTRTSTTGSAVLALDLDRPIGKLRDLVLSSMPLLRMSVSMKAKIE